MINTIEEQLTFILENKEHYGQQTEIFCSKLSEIQKITGVQKFVIIEDHELFYEAEGYEILLKELLEISNDEYIFSNISISEDNDSLSFIFQNKYYTYALEEDAEWFSYKFLGLLNTAYAENNIPMAFYEVGGFFEEAGYFFLSYEAANELERFGFPKPIKSNRKDNKLIVNGELIG